MEGDKEMQRDPMDDPEEQAHFKQVVSAFFNYTVDTNNLTFFIVRFDPRHC